MVRGNHDGPGRSDERTVNMDDRGFDAPQRPPIALPIPTGIGLVTLASMNNVFVAGMVMNRWVMVAMRLYRRGQHHSCCGKHRCGSKSWKRLKQVGGRDFVNRMEPHVARGDWMPPNL